MAHKFDIGQIVEFEPGLLRSSAPGPYEIRRLVPASDRDPEDPCYRIKSLTEKHEGCARKRAHTPAKHFRVKLKRFRVKHEGEVSPSGCRRTGSIVHNQRDRPAANSTIDYHFSKRRPPGAPGGVQKTRPPTEAAFCHCFQAQIASNSPTSFLGPRILI
jgi:hypothetical protein